MNPGESVGIILLGFLLIVLLRLDLDQFCNIFLLRLNNYQV